MVANPKTGYERILALPDAHFPYIDESAMACVLHVVRVWRPHKIVILGDWLDAAAFSSHGRRSFSENAPSFLQKEIAPCNAFIDKLQGRGNRPIVFLEGNHEARVERFAVGLGGPGHDLYRLTSPKMLLTHRVDEYGNPHAKRKNFAWIPYIGAGVHSHYVIAKERKLSSALIAIHGWSTAKGAAQVHLDKARDCSVIHGHTHRAQGVTSRHRLTDKLLRGWSPGCLRDLHPEYTANQPSDWTHGFSMITVRKDCWVSYTVPIFSDGSCILPNGNRVVG